MWRSRPDVSSTLSRRMGLAVPSVAEASRGLPSVKATFTEADDEIVTSVAYQPQPADEPVSPELALVDPELAERLRPLLPAPVQEVAEEAPHASVALAIEQAEQQPAAAATEEPDAAAEASGATVHVLPMPAQRGDSVRPAPEVETVLTVAAVAADVQPASPAPPASPPASSTTLHRLLMAFGAGAVVASLVVVGVIAEMGETGPQVDAGALEAGGPVVGTPSPAPSGLGEAPKPTPAKPKIASPKPATRKAGTTAKSAGSSTKPKTAPASTRKRAAASPAKSRSKQTAPKRTAPQQTAAPIPSRRFAWAPVEAAVGYRVELFRGDQQVLRATTKQPVYELAARWRHQGRAERLTPGSYRWYVWPVLPSGPAAEAVVQARLDVP